eukprot:scaffold229205_cov27-Tisochrysis_lutea.AAC.1
MQRANKLLTRVPYGHSFIGTELHASCMTCLAKQLLFMDQKSLHAAELGAACTARESAQLALERQAVVCDELRREVEAARAAGLAQEAALAAAKDAAARSMAK